MSTSFEIPLSAPDVTDREIRRVIEVLKGPYLSLGPGLTAFEEAFARYTGTRFAVAVNSGTSALHLAVKGLGIGEGDAVITTPFSFVASANCLLFERAVPVFVDIDPGTFNIDPARIAHYLASACRKDRATGGVVDLRSGRRVRAILPVHVFGTPCDMDAIREIAASHRLRIIEDACEAIGAEFGGAKAGSLGDAGVFGFYPNKQMTTGEGGMVVTNDKNLADLCRGFRNQGRANGNGWLEHDTIGYNYRLDEMSCALGLAQLERIDEILAKRSRVADLYNERLPGALTVSSPPPRTKKSWFVYIVCLPEGYTADQRDRLLAELRARHIGCNNYFPPIHLQPFYRKTFGYKEDDFPVTEAVSQRTIALPFHNNLREDEVTYVVETLRALLARDLTAGDSFARSA
ncbi:MAG: DegT/DnrJ/EryC1/StrS family aminotransferase [Syntrophorhabdales bacterium]